MDAHVLVAIAAPPAIAVTVQPNAGATVLPAVSPAPVAQAVHVEPLSISALARGPAGADGYRGFHFVQGEPAMVWTIRHNLGRKPMVRVEDSAGDEIVGIPTSPDLNTTVVTFSAAFGGEAYLI